MLKTLCSAGRPARKGLSRVLTRLAVALFCLPFSAAAAPALAAYDNAKPIWSQVDELVCRGSFRLVCVEENCFRKISKATWRIDFKQKKIFMGGLGGIEGAPEFADDIVAMDFAFYGDDRGSRHVIYFSGRLMSFDVDNAADAGGEAVTARSVHYEWRKPFGFDWEESDRSVETRFGCAAKGAPIEFQAPPQ